MLQYRVVICHYSRSCRLLTFASKRLDWATYVVKVNMVREKLYFILEEYVRHSPSITSTLVGVVSNTRGSEDNIGKGDKFDVSKRAFV